MKIKANRISAIVTLVLCLSVSQASALTISLAVSDSNIMPGESFSIEVWANNVFNIFPGDEVLAFGFDVTNQNPSIVSFDSVSVGPFFNDDSAFFPNTDVAGSAFPGVLDNSIHLATLNYTALSLGSVALGIASDAMDFNEGLLYFMAGNIDITSSRNVNVPEPSTYLLLASGLVGLGFMRRKCKFQT